MSPTLSYISTASSLAPAVSALVRYKKIHPVFFPFLLCMWLAAANDIIGSAMVANSYSTAVSNNIYVLLEAVLLMWQFKNWEIFSKKENHFLLRLILLLALWVVDCFFFSGIYKVATWFRIGYSFMLVLLAINMLNAILISDFKGLARNCIFVICTCIIAFYTFKVFVEIFWLYGRDLSKIFRSNIYLITLFLNILCNLFYFIATLWMPRKINFSSLY
ncbi:MAG: hypothetical protein V4722_06805 [Bacteroidota bacterium]